MSPESREDDHILADELGKLAQKGAAGARFAARHMPNNTYELTQTVAIDLERVIAGARNVITGQGREVREERPDGGFLIKGVVGAGLFNMNPAVVTIRLTPLDSGQVAIAVTGTANEGLIKQRAGEKAATRIAEALLVEIGQ